MYYNWFDAATGQYYLHLFHTKQPDLKAAMAMAGRTSLAQLDRSVLDI